MGFLDEKLCITLKNKAEEEDSKVYSDRKVSNEYLAEIRRICEFGIERASTIRDTFPMYTKHDETHICNVMRLMESLLGDSINKLSRDEAAMLILSACCHDIGMSYSADDKLIIFDDLDRLNKYLDKNHSEYVKAYADGRDTPVMTDDMMQNYLRSIHHERISELLGSLKWSNVLNGKVDREDLIRVCQSHGQEISSLDNLEVTPSIDMRFCAVMLRLADILDFDTSRAPQVLYDYCGFDNKNDSSALRSKEEWDKHLCSNGFDFLHIEDRTFSYMLPYSANSKTMQAEHAINVYLDWVDKELDYCGKKIKWSNEKWKNLILPFKVSRSIKSEGYVSGQYRLTLDQNKIMELLVGKDLYSDPSVFVRELIQNAIDAVRTRERLDNNNRPDSWKPQIKIRTWMDNEGYHWFRIEDNGIGMTKDTIENFFLKVGCSYYTSDTFLQEKIRCKADMDYTPISRFGIGILSCFMGDEHTNHLEVSTKHFKKNEKEQYTTLRLRMHGMSGYYYMADKSENHSPGPMKGVTNEEKRQYMKDAGTAIAVRTNLYQTGKYRGFKEIVDSYVVFPPVAIHYDGVEGSFDYPTETEFKNAIHNINPSDDLNKDGLFEFHLSAEQLNEIYMERPELSFSEPPKLLLKCIDLSLYTESSFLSGAVLTAEAVGEHEEITVKLGERNVRFNVKLDFSIDETSNIVSLLVLLITPIGFDTEMNGLSMRRYEDIHGNLVEFETFDAFRAMKKGWEFEFCKLSDFDWYIKYFQAGRNSIAAHNGVYCGNADFFLNISIDRKYNKLGAILLFKDNYRPNVDVARDVIRQITLETACDLAIIKKQIQNSGFYLKGYNELQDIDYSYVPTKDYLAILEKRKDLRDKLIISTEKGDFTLDELRVELKKHQKMELKNVPEFYQEVILYKDVPRLYKYLCMAMLRKEFSLVAEIKLYIKKFSLVEESNQYLPHICVCEKRAETQGYENEDIFPPSFFIAPLEGGNQYLTKEDSFFRFACNANHRFSIWLQKNGADLKKYVPGIFKEMLRILAEAEGKKLINGINDLLSRLRTLPNNLFYVPDEIFLNDNDLY